MRFKNSHPAVAQSCILASVGVLLKLTQLTLGFYSR